MSQYYILFWINIIFDFFMLDDAFDKHKFKSGDAFVLFRSFKIGIVMISGHPFSEIVILFCLFFLI